MAQTKDVSAQRLLAAILSDMGRSGDALERLQGVLASRPNDAKAHCDVAAILHERGRSDEAIDHYRRALLVKPDYAPAHLGLGTVLAAIGRGEEARSSLERAIDIEPANSLNYYTLGQSARFTSSDRYFAAMRQLADDLGSLSMESQKYLHFALGKAYDDVGDYDRAFHHFQQGNILKRRQTPYVEHNTLSRLERVRSVFTPALMRSSQGVGNPSAVPIFIVGMHRSGSTLVEQILSSHPQCFGAGELDDIGTLAERLRGPSGVEFPEAIATVAENELRELGTQYLGVIRGMSAGAARVTDKMPPNFIYLGLINLLFPNARIIHTKRDPRDTAISNFCNILGARLGYTSDLSSLGRFYRHYQSLMEHWQNLLNPNVMLDVQYEMLVSDFEHQARRIVSHCELEWDQDCAAFYLNTRPVRTASVGQVHQPIYQTSIARWKRYEKFMAPFTEALEGR
jgi:tetratricopeptide (TPR) repeat protein